MVLYVPGNHDYYNHLSDVQTVDAALTEIESAIPNLHILRAGQPFEYQGFRFLGDTMWVKQTQAMVDSRNLINDSSIIGFWDNMPQKNTDFLKYLDTSLREGDIVVTHHLPSEESTPLFFRVKPNNSLQPWFVCNQERLIIDRKPRLWIHGHTHTRCDYMLGNTRIFCNPLGYPKENKGFSHISPSVIEVLPPQPLGL